MTTRNENSIKIKRTHKFFGIKNGKTHKTMSTSSSIIYHFFTWTSNAKQPKPINSNHAKLCETQPELMNQHRKPAEMLFIIKFVKRGRNYTWIKGPTSKAFRLRLSEITRICLNLISAHCPASASIEKGGLNLGKYFG